VSSFINTNDQLFEQEVIKSPIPVLVEFGAEWCGPCRQLEPLLEQLAAEWNGKVRLAKVDVDQAIATTMQFQVMSVPTLILFINGEARQRLTGKLPRDQIVSRLSPYL
jgi:thioredoxin 1